MNWSSIPRELSILEDTVMPSGKQDDEKIKVSPDSTVRLKPRRQSRTVEPSHMVFIFFLITIGMSPYHTNMVDSSQIRRKELLKVTNSYLSWLVLVVGLTTSGMN